MTTARPLVFAPEHYYGGTPLQDLVEGRLHPGEPLLGIVEFDLSRLLDPRLPRKYRRPKAGRSEPDGCFTAVFMLFHLTEVLSEALETGIDSLLRRRRVRRLGPAGAPFAGGWESRAGEFVIVVRSGHEKDTEYNNNDALLAYTDRRVLVLDRVSRDLELLAELPRQQLGRLENKQTERSLRMDLHFADGSSIALDLYRDHAAALEAMHQGRIVPHQPRPESKKWRPKWLFRQGRTAD
ncbi:hypothetical protein [Kitasatospora sp. NPDC101183]|uniref:hypothetical protein n=1 Tax=Kitasatospora sp. NPDC101183 TaxID=3364100 RepID=UPI00382F2789